MEVELPDGTVLDLPDGMTPEQTKAAVQNYVTKHHPTVAKRLGTQLMKGTRNVVEGAAAPFTMVGDLTNSLINAGIGGYNKLTGSDVQPLGLPSQGVHQALLAAGFPEDAPNEGIAGAAVRAGTGGLVTMGAGTIPALANAAPEIASALTINPASQLVAATAGGVTSEAARQGLEGVKIFENPTLDNIAKSVLITGAGFGGGVGAYGVSRGVANATEAASGGIKSVLDILTPAGREKIAGQVIRQASGDPQSLASRLSDLPEPSVPGVRPTTAQALGGDSQLSALELGLRNDPSYRHAFDVRAAENQAARSAALETMAPVNGGADDVAQLVVRGFQEYGDDMRAAVQQAEQQVQQRIAALGQQADQQAVGGIIREELQAAYARARAATSAAYRGIDPGNTSAFPGPAVYDRVAPLIEQYFANSTGGTPQELLPIMTRLRNSPNLTFGQIDAIRQDLQKVAGQAYQSGDRRLASVAGQMADAVGSTVDDAAAAGQGFTPEQAQAYQQARQLRAEQGATFERGQVGQVLKTGPYGEPRIPDSGVPAELFFRSGGSPEAAQQFIQAAGGRPAAVAAMRQYIAGRMREAITSADGTVDPARLQAFQRDYGGALLSFPELQSQLGGIAQAQSAVDAATLAETAARDQMRGSPLNNFATKNPSDAVAAIVNSADSERQVTIALQQLSQTQGGVEAFRRSVLDWLTGRIENAGVQPSTGDALQSFAKFKAIMDKKAPTLTRIFSPEEMQTLRGVFEQLGAENRVTSAKPLGSNTFTNLATRYLVERLTNSYAPMMGKTNSALTPGLSWITRGVDEQVRQSLVDALLNPSTAARVVGLAAPLPIRDISRVLPDTARAILSQQLLMLPSQRPAFNYWKE